MEVTITPWHPISELPVKWELQSLPKLHNHVTNDTLYYNLQWRQPLQTVLSKWPMFEGMEALMLWKIWGKRMRLFSAYAVLPCSMNCFTQTCKRAGEELFKRACSDRPRCFLSWNKGRFRFDIGKKFFTMRMVKNWNRLLREIVNSPFLEAFKTRLDKALSKLV